MTSENEHYWINHLELAPHAEGGFFKEVYHASETLTTNDKKLRSYYTSIYFLLNHESPSRFHRLASDEIWYYHAGDTLTIHLIYPAGSYQKVLLGKAVEKGEVLQFAVPKGVIFGSNVEDDAHYALVSCMVSPGFDYHDFELFTQEELLRNYPQHETIIHKLAYTILPD